MANLADGRQSQRRWTCCGKARRTAHCADCGRGRPQLDALDSVSADLRDKADCALRAMRGWEERELYRPTNFGVHPTDRIPHLPGAPRLCDLEPARQQAVRAELAARMTEENWQGIGKGLAKAELWDAAAKAVAAVKPAIASAVEAGDPGGAYEAAACAIRALLDLERHGRQKGRRRDSGS